jgi:hypothetical protein
MKRLATVCFLLLSASGLASGGLAPAAEPASDPRTIAATKLVFLPGNFLVNEEVDRCVKIMKDAAAAGYTGVLVSDCKFSRWEQRVGDQRAQYDGNLKRLRQAARDLNLQFIISVCDQGADLLSGDPNLAEGMPVEDAPFLVKNHRLVPADDDMKLVNPGLEAADNGRVPGWYIDELGRAGFVDTQVKVEGKNSIRFEDIKANSPVGNGRIIQRVRVKPLRYYHLSVQVKTEGFDAPGTFNILALAFPKGTSEQALDHQQFALKPTADWTKYEIVFNTLDSEEVGIYIGSWGGQKGKLWLDDVRLEPGGLVNLIRRPSLKFQVTSADGKTVYREGRDFVKAVDPKLGNMPFLGAFQTWYQGPLVAVPSASRLKEGQRVLVSYSHAMIVYGYAVFACWNEPKMWQIMGRNLKTCHEVMRPDGYMMTHDELRHMGWDASCRKSGKTCGQMLAANVKRCTEMIREEDPGKPIYVWSDMFDPNHNAADKGKYYLVRGEAPFVGSWEGLDKDVIIMNWIAQEKTLAWFAGRGHKQILCGYYDAPSEKMTDWLRMAVKYPGVSGVMYTTWANDFHELAKYARIVDEFKP